MLSRKFCKKSVRENFCHFHISYRYFNWYTVWKLLRFSLTHFWQKFRESNVFTKELIWGNIFFVRLNFSLFHTEWYCAHCLKAEITWIQLFWLLLYCTRTKRKSKLISRNISISRTFTVRKSTIKRDHDFNGKINVFPSNQRF